MTTKTIKITQLATTVIISTNSNALSWEEAERCDIIIVIGVDHRFRREVGAFYGAKKRTAIRNSVTWRSHTNDRFTTTSFWMRQESPARDRHISEPRRRHRSESLFSTCRPVSESRGLERLPGPLKFRFPGSFSEEGLCWERGCPSPLRMIFRKGPGRVSGESARGGEPKQGFTGNKKPLRPYGRSGSGNSKRLPY